MSRKIIDYGSIIGKKFGKITVLSESSVVRGRYHTYNVVCECGKEYIMAATNILYHKPKGCRKCATKKEFGYASSKAIYRTYKQKAKKRGYTFELSFEQFLTLSQQNCFHCGIEPYRKYSDKGGNGHYTYNGIDRLDNSKGYIIENCVPCCKNCNIAKNDLSIEEFEKWIIQIYNYKFQSLE